MFSKTNPIFILLATSSHPNRALAGGGSERYHSVAPSGSSGDSSQRGSATSTASAGLSQSTSAYASKCLVTDRRFSRSSKDNQSASFRPTDRWLEDSMSESGAVIRVPFPDQWAVRVGSR